MCLPLGLQLSADGRTKDDASAGSTDSVDAEENPAADIMSEPGSESVAESADESETEGAHPPIVLAGELPPVELPGGGLPPPPEPETGVVDAVGLVNWDIAQTSKAKCLVCRDGLPEGCLRLCYKPHRTAVTRFVHSWCAKQLPAGTREHDFRMAQRFSADPRLEPRFHAEIDAVVDQLNDHASGSSSAHV